MARVAVISEFKEHVKLDQYRKLGYYIAQDQYEHKINQGMHTTRDKQDWAVCFSKANNIVIVLIKELYPSTRNKIRTILNKGKQVIAIFKEERYDIKYYERPYKGSNPDKKGTMVKNQMYLDLLNKKQELKEIAEEAKEAQRKADVLELYEELPECHEEFIRDFARLYDIQVDFEDELSKRQAYAQINFYIEHNIEYTHKAIPGFIQYQYADCLIELTHEEAPDMEYGTLLELSDMFKSSNCEDITRTESYGEISILERINHNEGVKLC